MLFRSEADSPALLRLTCVSEDATLNILSRGVLDDEVEQRAERNELVLTLTTGGRTLSLPGYIARAPEATVAGFETPLTPALMDMLKSPGLSLETAGVSLKVSDAGMRRALDQFIAACPAPAAAADASGWGSYTGLSHGYRLELPKSLFRLQAGDRNGRHYTAERGLMELRIYGEANAMERKFPAVVQELAPDIDKVTLRRTGKDFLVLSGHAGSRIVYFLGRATCNNSNVAFINLTYDPEAIDFYAPIITRMAQSFLKETWPDGKPLCP